MGNSEVRYKILGAGVQSLEQALGRNRLRWLRQFLLMPTERLSSCTLFLE